MYQRSLTYAAPLKVTLRLIVYDVDEENETRSIKDVKEQDVYMGDLPLMTKMEHLLLMVQRELLFLKCIVAQESSLIMIKVKLILQEKFICRKNNPIQRILVRFRV